MKSHDIRASFVDFFVERGHQRVDSAPLVPHGDPSLLFTNAGMVQFKDAFVGRVAPPAPRVVTVQKCMRVSGKHNDLENVGPSPRHHTFFEMLGNFSFGEYFKAEAIELAWALVTEVWALPADRLFATVFREDDEAARLWVEISGLPPERVRRCGEEDNFWAMGETGPCGPCSEIFVDRQPEASAVPWEEGTESGRYLELWNLVFMQYDRDQDGGLSPLPDPSIDTGAGLERVAAELQGVDSTYDTDLFQPLLRAAAELARTRYGSDADADVSLRVVADHLRAVTFLLADGVIPSSEGRGYVLRRILRRAMRHGMRLGFDEPFLHRLVPVVGEAMGDAYPELATTEDATRSTVEAEERKFLDTLASGSRQVQEAIETARAAGREELDGETVFRLYDTHGLPVEIVREIATEERMGLDESGFERELEAQRRRSRAASAEGRTTVSAVAEALAGEVDRETEFVGYDRLELAGVPLAHLALVRQRVDGPSAAPATALEQGQEGAVVVPHTVFYAESGGQVADRGTIGTDTGRARVLDVQRDPKGVVHHLIAVEEGRIERGQQARLEVVASARRATERNHTATHLLHAALRRELGDGVRQAGSLVHPERLRFDFTYDRGLCAEEVVRIEALVNRWIRGATAVEARWESYEEAVERGAMALFGEKYGDRVRTVAVPDVSLELCGGCHVGNTGEIGLFLVTGERGVASGVRRIEAVSGERAYELVCERRRLVDDIASRLGVEPTGAVKRIEELQAEIAERERELSELRRRLVSGRTGEGEIRTVAGVKVLAREVPPAPRQELGDMADMLRARLESGVVVIGCRDDGDVSLIAAVSEDLVGRVHAGELVGALGEIVGGGGGGRPDFAQAGGSDPSRLEEALQRAGDEVRRQLGAEGSE